jgi:hypothetical protein
MADRDPKRKRSDAAMSGMIATAALAVLAVLTVIVVWIGG